MNYLLYVERNSENLRFYLWFKSYCARFESLPEPEKHRSVVWESCPLLRDKDIRLKEKEAEGLKSPSTPVAAGPSPLDIAMQPFRPELQQITNTFLLSSSPLELNLSASDRSSVLSALSCTTHPSAFASIFAQIESSLRLQSHPNFIRYALSTTNTGRITAMRVGGVILIISAIILAVALSLGRVHRAIRVICPCILLFFGICSVLDGQRGVCLILLSLGVRDRFPWEKDVDTAASLPPFMGSAHPPGEDLTDGDIEKLSCSSGSFDLATAWDGPIPRDGEREEKVEVYKRRGMVGHVLFGWRKLRGVDGEVRRLQRVMVLQNVAVASVVTLVAGLVLGVAVKGGDMY